MAPAIKSSAAFGFFGSVQNMTTWENMAGRYGSAAPRGNVVLFPRHDRACAHQIRHLVRARRPGLLPRRPAHPPLRARAAQARPVETGPRPQQRPAHAAGPLISPSSAETAAHTAKTAPAPSPPTRPDS